MGKTKVWVAPPKPKKLVGEDFRSTKKGAYTPKVKVHRK